MNYEQKTLPITKLVSNSGQLKDVPKNPRTIKDARFNALKKSIEDAPEMLSLRELIVVPFGDKFVTICGNMRLSAARDLGMKTMPCKVLAEDTPAEKMREYAMKDNIAFGQDDIDLILAEWDSEELAEWGFELPEEEVVEEQPEVKEDDFNHEEAEKLPPKVKRGEVWQLGKHRLMCGDSTSAEDVEKLRGGELADLVFTDPPYGMKKEADGVMNDNLNYDDLLEFNKKWIPLSFNALKDVGSWYCWGIDEPLMDIYSEIIRPRKKLAKSQKITFCNLITWSKGAGGRGVGSKGLRCYFPNEEKCLFVMKGQQSYVSNKDDYWEGFEPIRQRLLKEKELSGLSMKEIVALTSTAATHWFAVSQWAMIPEKDWNILHDYCVKNGKQGFRADYEQVRADYEQVRADYEQVRAEWYKTRAYFDNTHDNMNSVWNFSVTSQKERELCGQHATPKPIALCERGIKSSCPPKGIVLDLFGGSGSTLIACEQLDRRCLMMELDPHYCDVIIARWETLTGKQAVKIA